MRLYIFLLFLISGSILHAQKSSVNCYNSVKGSVLNKKENSAITNAQIVVSDKNNDLSYYKTNQNGNFQFDLPCNDSRYIIACTVENHTLDKKLVFTSKNEIKTHHVVLNLFPINEFIEYNGRKRVIMKSIQFMPNEHSITKESEKDMNQLYRLLIKYPDLKIEIGIHSDSRGEESYINELTQKRADACADYLFSKGIESDRIVAKGYGFTQLLNDCKKGIKCTDDQHLINRRTEVLVID